MDPSVFNTVNVLEYLFDEPGQLSVSLSYLCVIIVKRLRIGIVRIASTIWSLAFFRLFWDVIHGGLLTVDFNRFKLSIFSGKHTRSMVYKRHRKMETSAVS